MTIKNIFTAGDPDIGSIYAQLEHLRTIGHPIFQRNSPALTADQIAILVETAYWSSLRENEGRMTNVRIAAAKPEASLGAQRFSMPVPYDEAQIAKLGPAVPPRGCLLVDPDNMQIWAIYRQQFSSSDNTLILDVIRPGVVQVGVGPYRTFMVFSGRTATKVLASGYVDLPHSIRSALRKVIPNEDILETQAVWREALALADVAKNVRTNGHGGALLLVPDDNENWLSCIEPLAFRFDTKDSSLPDSIRLALKGMNERGNVLQEISQTNELDREKLIGTIMAPFSDWVERSSIDAIARLAAVDGAVVLTSSACVLGFGAKISVKEQPPRISWMGSGSESQLVQTGELEQLGGMRHQSAARFVGANRNCAAIVVSEDGPMSFMSWHSEWDCVLVIKNVDWWC